MTRYAMLAPSGRVWALDERDGAGNPTTREDAERIAGEFGWVLVVEVDGAWVPLDDEAGA
jgi:hypothetical protein